MLKDTTNNFVNDMMKAEMELMPYAETDGRFDDADGRIEALALRCMGLLHKSYRVIREQAEAIDNINAKLDKLIEKK